MSKVPFNHLVFQSEVKCRISDVRQVLGGRKKRFSCTPMGRNIKRKLYDSERFIGIKVSFIKKTK